MNSLILHSVSCLQKKSDRVDLGLILMQLLPVLIMSLRGNINRDLGNLLLWSPSHENWDYTLYYLKFLKVESIFYFSKNNYVTYNKQETLVVLLFSVST